jgi:hypothetical protein
MSIYNANKTDYMELSPLLEANSRSAIQEIIMSFMEHEGLLSFTHVPPEVLCNITL